MATGVTIRVDGTPIKGETNYVVEEESTPVDISDSSGATGRITTPFFSTASIAAKRMRRKQLSLEDRGKGSTVGIVRIPSRAEGIISLTADARTILLNADRTVQPYDGNLWGYIIYLLDLVGITAGYDVHSDYASVPVTFPGWHGDVWLNMKRLLATKGAEITLASNIIVIRPIRGRITVDRRDINYSWAFDDTELALSVEGYWYETEYDVSGLAYPAGGWNEDVTIYQVDANEDVVVEIEVDASLVSVKQPTVMDFVASNFVTDSVYSVTGNDDKPITAAQWTAAGGYINVEIGEDTRSLIVTIHGADIEKYAPFRIAASAGKSSEYSSLRLIGEGVFFQRHLMTFPTAVDPEIATQEVGYTVDTPFITSLDELYDLIMWPLARYGAGRQTITVETTGINRQGESNGYVYPSIADFNNIAALEGWTTIADFNAAWAGMTIADFNQAMASYLSSSFTNQAFGNIAGARTFRDGIWWRIRRATISPGRESYTAEADTTVNDFNANWGGADIADFNAAWAGMTIADFNVAPLERTFI